MANTCVKCGALLADGQAFCASCGARRSSTPPASPSALEPQSKLVGPLLKIAALALGLLISVILLGFGGSAYLAYRERNKISAIENALKKHDIAAAVSKKTSRANNSIVPPPAATLAPAKPLQVSDQEAERTVGGPEADLVVRTGAISNLGFGWPTGFDPFSGRSTPAHPYPWTPPAGAPEGTKRILIGSTVTPEDAHTHKHDGYVSILSSCPETSVPCQERLDSMPRPISLAVGALPDKIDAVVFQLFVDDFQAPVWKSRFQVSVNSTRIPNFEDAVNALDQTGPIGKLVTLKFLPEYWPLLQSGTVNLLVDDPTTHLADGYAIDFVRILVNPHKFNYEVLLSSTVMDADKNSPIAGATVSAALGSGTTDQLGHCELAGLPAGLVVATASAAGYDGSSVQVDLVAGQSGKAEFRLHRHDEGTEALERSVAQTGSATVYGIHFDIDSAKLRSDSAPALTSILGLLNDKPGSRWVISGHTDNQGGTDTNLKLSEARAASVVSWLGAHGVVVSRLEPKGFGASRPVADNATANGRALNRRVEIALAK